MVHDSVKREAMNEVASSEESAENNDTVDLLFSINGLPIATCELKNPNTDQTWRAAIKQYKEDREPTAPLFKFKTRSLVHFAADPLVPRDVFGDTNEVLLLYDLTVLTQFWCSLGTCGTLAGIDDESVISRKPLPRSEQGDASPRVQDRPGLDHGG